MAFDPVTGDLVDTAFIPSISAALASPKEARRSPRGTITVSDQISDLVQDFTLGGTYIGWFAPAGGVNNAILDNIRGHAYRPNGNLVVTVASGTNAHALAEFDSAGNYIGNFVANGAGGMNSPFGILFRTNDVLVSQSSAPTGVNRYDLNGTPISQWASISSFPQQVFALENGDIAVANFQGTGSTGIRLYASDGTFLRLLSGVTGNRGVYQLPSGDFLTTNGAGIHEIDSTTGGLVRTIYAAASLQYIDLVDLSAGGLPGFTVTPTSVDFDTVVLGWNKSDSVLVRNTGSAPLVITSITTSHSSFTVSPGSATVSPSDSLVVHVTFAPDSAVVRNGTLTFLHNAAGSPSQVALTGVGKYYTVLVTVVAGWNFLSLPVIPPLDSVRVVFPTSVYPYVFLYNPGTGYQQSLTLPRGYGFWAKFLAPEIIPISGWPKFTDSIAVLGGWNVLGSISFPVDTGDVITLPPGIRASSFFGFSTGGYYPATVIEPGFGYWVKAYGSGEFILSAPAPGTTRFRRPGRLLERNN
jgi:hypothetical protein